LTQVQMALSQHDREALSDRVERKLAGRRIPREAIRAAVEQVCSAIDSSGTPESEPDVVLVMSAPSTPDIASRIRHRLNQAGIKPMETGTGSAGRYAVCAMRVLTRDEAGVRAAAADLGLSIAAPIDTSELTE
jgi:hypothetical protein